MPPEDWHLVVGFDTEDLEEYQLSGSRLWRALVVYDPIYHWIGRCISFQVSEKSKEASHWVLTFHTAVAVLAEANCLAAPAFAFVAMATTGAGTKPNEPTTSQPLTPLSCVLGKAVLANLLVAVTSINCKKLK